jgi:hypothetical protein
VYRPEQAPRQALDDPPRAGAAEKSLRLAYRRPFPPGMKISGHGEAAASYAVRRPPAATAQPVRSDEKLELKPSDGFASTQLPPGVGENLNIKA